VGVLARKGNGFGGFKTTSYSKYSPSVEAGIFNIRGKQPKFITGIGIRPLPLIKRTTKRKSKRGIK
jgi:hypothetical protein